MIEIGANFGWQPKLLVVEDDAGIREPLCKVLKKRGHHIVEQAADGQEGLDKLQAFKPDLVLLDYHMPKMTGLGMMEQYIGSPNKRDDLYVLLHSATSFRYEQTMLLNLMAQAGISSALLEKPCEPELIIQTLGIGERVIADKLAHKGEKALDDLIMRGMLHDSGGLLQGLNINLFAAYDEDDLQNIKPSIQRSRDRVSTLVQVQGSTEIPKVFPTSN